MRGSCAWLMIMLVGLGVLGVRALGAAATTQQVEVKGGREITIQKYAWTECLGFADEGKTAYVVARVYQVNAWRVFVYYWPEAVGGLTGILVLRRLVRVLRRPQVWGEEYCRKCNYMLKGIGSDKCPECGTALTAGNRLHGRPRGRRLVGWTMVLIGAAGGYFLGRGRVPREMGASGWIDLRSMRLAEWAVEGWRDERLWLRQHVERDDMLFLVDVEQGRVVKTMCRLKLGGSEYPELLSLSPDRKSLFCAVCVKGTIPLMCTGLAQLDIRSGKVVRRFTDAKPAFPLGEGATVDALDRTVFLANDGRLVAWDVASGRKLNERPGGGGRYRDRTMWAMTLEGTETAVVSVAVDAVKGIEVWDPRAGGVLRSFTVDCRKRQWSCENGRLYAFHFGGVDVWDLLSGRKIETLSAEVDRSDFAWGGISGPVLFVPVRDVRGRVSDWRVLDLRRRLRSSCVVGPNSYWSWAMSPDGLKLIASDPTEASGLRCYDHGHIHIRVYDLSAGSKPEP